VGGGEEEGRGEASWTGMARHPVVDRWADGTITVPFDWFDRL